MANTVGNLRVKTSIRSYEKVTSTTISGALATASSGVRYLPNHSELWVPSSSTSTVDCTFIDETTVAGADEDGYLAGRKVYAKADTSTPAAAITGLSNVEMVWIKHTGYLYARTSDATCDTTDTKTNVSCDDSSVHFAGQWITGSGVPNETYITLITSPTTFTLSNAATATATDATLISTGLSTTANSTDHLEVRSTSGSGAIISILKPNEGIFLHPQGHTDSGDYFFQSVDPGDLTDGAADIAVEFICLVAS